MKKNSLLFLSVSIVLAIICAVLFALRNAELNKLKVEYAAVNTATDSLQTLYEFYNGLLEADMRLLEDEDYDRLSKELNAMSDSAPASAAAAAHIKARIDYIDEVLADRKDGASDTARRDFRLAQLSNDLAQAKSIVDSLEALNSKVRSETAGELEKLGKRLSEKEKELKRKERVKVISFSGAKNAHIHYLGEVENGKANGGGIGIWTTGSIYRGEWQDNKRHGSGTFEWVDGEKYEGEYVNGTREGEGTYYWPSGERYEGEWSGDRRNGFGTLYDMDGNIRFEGQWKDDKPVNGE